MRFSVSAAAATAAFAGVAVADPLTIINPCPAATSSSVHPITVTKQFQEVSTCAPTTACLRGSCTTKYPFETFAYVSTVIPAAWNGKNMEAVTVTSTTQTVTVSRFQTTITKWVTPAPVIPKSGTIITPKPTSIELTIAKDYFAPFNKLGGLAIPDFDGSGLCRECETQSDGSRSQVVGVVECRAGPGGSKCMGYDETWVSKAAPSTSATTANACSTRWTAPSAGTFTFTFPFTAPARTITAAETTITVGPVPYWAHVTRVCHRPNEVIDFTTTVTKTIFWTAPCSRQPPRSSSAVPVPTGNHAFPGWPRPGPNGGDNGNTGGNNGVDSSKGDPYGWADWGSDDVADPSASIPSEWADWVATATTTAVTTKGSSVSQSFTYTTGTYTLTTGGGVGGTSTSSFSFSHGGPTGYSTTTSGLSSTTSTSGYSFSTGGPGGETTTSGGYGSSTTYDHGTTTSTITSLTTTTVATTTTAPATTTSLVAIPVDPENFVIGVNTAGKYRKRALRYIKISGGDAVLVTEKDEASKFEFEGGYLKSGGLFVDADTTQPWLSFSLTATLNANISQWTIGADGSISLVAPNNGVCVSADNSVFIQFSGNTPFQCAAIALVAEVPNPTTTTSVTTTTFVPTTTAEPTTTTTTSVFDPSGDLDADIPAPTVVRRGVQYGGQRFGRSRRH